MERGKKSKYFVLTEFLSYKEVALFFLFFLFLMIIIFPQGRIEEILASPEETNIDLSKKYLEALIRTKSPSHLKEALLKKFAQVGDEEEVKRVIQEVKKSDPLLALEVEYDLLKREYFSKKKERERIRKQMRETLREILHLERRPEQLEIWFRESARMNFPELAYLFARKLANITNSPKWYEEAFLYAVYSGRYEEAKQLIGKFKPQKKESYLLLYHYLLEEGRYSEAYKLLIEYTKKYPTEREKLKREILIALFLAGKFEEGEEMLRTIAKEKEKRRKILLYVLKKLIAYGAYSQTKKVIERHLTLFLEDERALTEVLKISLQTGDPKFAAKIAERILEEE
ncbi:hypothetical protein [Aquifex sp.]